MRARSFRLRPPKEARAPWPSAARGSSKAARAEELTGDLRVEAEEAEEAVMPVDKDRVEGSAKNIKGKVKEGFGKLTGDAKTEAEGKADQAEGKAQNAIGGIKDTLRGR
jgi:uncharacterized protein YjbJ (UPF0337 family)